MEAISNQHFTHSRLVMSTSSHTTERAYKPGGTAIMACNSLTSHVKNYTRDRMGRWTSMSFSLSSSKVVRVISAYQVCQGVRPGTTTAAAQQQAQIIMEYSQTNSTHRRTPRQAFVEDLEAFIRQVQRSNEEIILAGDFNDDISSPSSGMAQLATNCHLIDLFALRLGTVEAPSTYQRGKKRLDYILMSPNLLPHVQAAGYDPFNYRIPSDHRGMYIDFTTATLFQYTPTPLASPSRRDFSSKTPGVVNSYVEAKMKYLNDHNFFERLRNLLSQEVLNSELAESLDRDFQRASKHAACKCTRKARTPWSPELAFAWATLHFYRIARSAYHTQANHAPALSKLQHKWPKLPRAIPTEINEINDRYQDAIKQIKEIRMQAQELRENFLAQQVAKYSVTDQKDKARIIKQILRSETQQKIYKKIKYLRTQEEGSSGLCQLKIPKGTPVTDTKAMKALPDTPEFWETITVPKTIEEVLLHRNRHHFGQAHDTPFASPPLRMDIGYKADGYAADIILSGAVYQKSISPAARLLIQHIQSRSTTTIDGTITPKQIIQKLKVWREETTTSPSGLHLGHYHCLWRAPSPGTDQTTHDRILTWQQQLVQATADLINYAIRFGYTYQRWTKVINVMLQKDPGNPRVHRLRVIHIYEADYNLLLAVKWRQALHHAEDQKLLNDGMYGSRPGRSAYEPVFLEVLQHEIYRTSMKSGVHFDLDAASCYDRILPNVASLCGRRMGMDKAIVLVNALTLERARYHLKTNLGVSDGYYSHCGTHPIYGTGQGSGNSPTIWCFVCSLLFDTFETQAHGSTFSCYNNFYKMRMFMIGFVDDCSQRVNLFDHDEQPTGSTLIRLMESDAQLWNDILHASGGALEQSKCSFHLIQSDWNEDGTPFLTGATRLLPLTLVEGATSTTIQNKSNYRSHKTLGCHINPAHSNYSTWQATQAKNDTFARLLDTNYFTRWETQIFYSSVYLPSITYPLPMCPLSQQQCQALNARFYRSLLPRLGYNRNMATAIRYAPRHIGGVGVKHLYHEQGSLLLQQVYKHLNSPMTTVGVMLRIAISWTQAYLGTSKVFLNDVCQPIPPIGPSILIDLLQFLRGINAHLIIHNMPQPLALRQNDRFVMDIALAQRWSPRNLNQINACRRYLQAQTLADISNAEGSRLLPNVQSGSPPPNLARIRVGKFNQRVPGRESWKTWRRFLLTFSNPKGYLYTRLGSWTVDHMRTRHRAQYVWDPKTAQLYSHYEDDLYHTHTKVGPNDYVPVPTSTPKRVNGYPTPVIMCHNRLRPTTMFSIAPPPTLAHIPSSNTYQPQWIAELLNDVQALVPLQTILRHIKTNNILTCSDGSAASDRRTFGFVISTKQGLRLLKGSGIVRGTYGNSFRSEAYGVLATMLWLRQAVFLIDPHHTYPATTIHYLDNKSVIARIDSLLLSTNRGPNTQLLSEQDVVQEIMATMKSIPWKINLEWVRGHQDSHTPFHQLSLPAQLNCEADTAAATCTYSSVPETRRITPLPNSPCQLVIQDAHITRILKHKAIDAATIPTYKEYLRTKYKWHHTIMEAIDWEMVPVILRKHENKWPTMVKHIHDISPTGKLAHRNDPSLPASCPVCPHSPEDNNHVMLCPFHTRTQWRQETLTRIQKMDTAQSDPILMDILQDGIRNYFSLQDTIDFQQYPPQYHTLIQDQNSIGWDHMFKSRWTQQWRILQDAYKARSPHTAIVLTGEKWVSYLGRSLLHQWLKVWEIRNAERHGKDHEQQQHIKRQILTTELTEIYTYKDKVCPSDRQLFYPSVQDHLDHHPNMTQVEDWISMHREAIRTSAQVATRQGINRNRAINEYPIFNPDIQPGQQASLTAGLLPR